ncbi:Holliday junction branch migration protein RuvA [Candidatus Dojkabacteria bacterium]|nr:Holliday junction branch migration protein RuvA [Candidatus Dojkabacteria bacterium]
MIGFLKGKIQSVVANGIIITTGGVGYRVESSKTGLNEGDEIETYIYTHVRENEIKLFGFGSLEELNIFEELLGVSGVGPKSAMTIVSTLGVGGVVEALEQQNPEGLKVSGVGLKTAQKIVLELKGKLSLDDASKLEMEVKNEVYTALKGLGYTAQEIDEVVKKINIDKSWRSEDIIKVVLQNLQK